MTFRSGLSCWLLFTCCLSWPLRGAEVATPEQVRFFETEIRPILAEKCLRCHDAEKRKGGLQLDTRAALVAGGDSGPAIEPGDPGASLLIEAINYGSYEMPPDGQLPADQIARLTEWVQMGAPWPQTDQGETALRQAPRITDEDRAFWCFQPLREVEPPVVDDGGWCRNGIDRFIWQRLRAEGLEPSPEADKRTLIRRATQDLHGLPPRPEEVAAFLADDSPDAYAALIDRLLESPRYGERWARHWLDLVRYAESDGFKQDAYRPQAWRYRDYVIASFNADKPYDRFLTEQLAGDELSPGDPEMLVATSYLRLWIYEYNQRDVRTQWSNILNDITDVTSDVFLGLGMGCARCHDHKFDPLLQEDYYRLQAYFTPLLPRDDVPLLVGAELQQYQQQFAAWETATEEIRRELHELEQPLRDRVAAAAINKFPPDVRPLLRKRPAERTPFEHQLAELAGRQITEEHRNLKYEDKLKGEQLERWKQLRARLAEYDGLKPAEPPMAFTAADVGPEAPPTYIPGQPSLRDIPPGIPTVLVRAEAAADVPPAPLPSSQSTGSQSTGSQSTGSQSTGSQSTGSQSTGSQSTGSQSTGSQSTGRRLELARWIADPANPLSTRVITNRLWQYHFGQGLAASASDFGKLGEPPSHPELLDWLTRQFLSRGWSIKELHRLIMNSATYRQASRHGQALAAMERDPENRLLWRMPVRRLDGEQIRDAMLAASGELDLNLGGPAEEHSSVRRSIYNKVLRNQRESLLDVFDAPDGFNSTAQRNVTTTPTQSLLMINGPWTLARAEAFARRLTARDGASLEERVTAAYQIAYGRAPDSAELQRAVAFIESQQRTVLEQGPPQRPEIASLPGRSGQAARLPFTGSRPMRLQVRNRAMLPPGDFTIEAFVLLRSRDDKAAVRTIASQWDGAKEHAGWALGVTGRQSAHLPSSLIMQLSRGEGASGYEVVCSNFPLELERPYYVAAAVGARETGPAQVTFYLKDLTSDEPLQRVQVDCQGGGVPAAAARFTIGARDSASAHAWDGLLDDVRLTAAVVPAESLLLSAETPVERTVGWWRFEEVTGWYRDSSSGQNDVEAAGLTSAEAAGRLAAFADFCHVLLNSNEFLYVE